MHSHGTTAHSFSFHTQSFTSYARPECTFAHPCLPRPAIGGGDISTPAEESTSNSRTCIYFTCRQYFSTMTAHAKRARHVHLYPIAHEHSPQAKADACTRLDLQHVKHELTLKSVLMSCIQRAKPYRATRVAARGRTLRNHTEPPWTCIRNTRLAGVVRSIAGTQVAPQTSHERLRPSAVLSSGVRALANLNYK